VEPLSPKAVQITESALIVLLEHLTVLFELTALLEYINHYTLH